MVGLISVDILIEEGRATKCGACKVAESFVGTSERTLRKWRGEFYKKGEIRQSARGGNFQNALTSDENVKEYAIQWLREQTAKKNNRVTVSRFCKWFNEVCIPAHILSLAPNSPKSISRVTAWRWMQDLGFEFSRYQKGYVDGHEREDVVQSRIEYIAQLNKLQSTHLPPPLPSDSSDHNQESNEIGDIHATKKLVLIYHDESSFHAQEGRSRGWTEKGKQPLLPKGRGRALMVSDFVDEHNGFLELSQAQHEEAKRKYNDPNFPCYSREILEVGAEHEGYWTNDKFIEQLKKAVRIADFKYPEDQYTVVWIFDQSSNHRAFSEDALVASRMNLKPGGKQPVMRSTPVVVNGRPFVQSMVDNKGVPKGLKRVLEERGVNTLGMKKNDMVRELNKFDDFKNERSKVERFLRRFGHTVIFLPKFHPELNPIERIWGRVKLYTRDHCDYTYVGLQNTIVPAFNSVTIDLIRKYFRKSRNYLRAYEQGLDGLQADVEVKKYSSHRKVPEAESLL